MTGIISGADATIIVALIGAVVSPVVLFILHRRADRIVADLEAVRRETAVQRQENTDQHGEARQLLRTVADGLHMVVGTVETVATKVDGLAVKLDGHIENHGTPPQEAPK